jgi:RNA polymerase sigma-70 factor (ECF subfamily)
MSSRDTTELDELLGVHMLSLQKLAIRLTGSRESSEDILQESMLRIVRSWGSFQQHSSFKTWAIRIVVNVFRDSLSKNRETHPLEDHVDRRHEDPVSQVITDELRRYIAQRVSALPPRQREVLILLVYEGLSPIEVSQVLDMQIANVYATLYQARKRLRIELAPYLPDASPGILNDPENESATVRGNDHA